MTKFNEQSYQTQVRRLREIAVQALAHYPIDVRDIRFIKYSANAIYKVTDTKGCDYVFRIHPEDNHTEIALDEEMRWLEKIAKTTDLIVPKPIKTKNHNYSVTCQHPTMETARLCDLLTWLPGQTLWRRINTNYAKHLGKLIAQVQLSGKGFECQHRSYWSAEGLVGAKQATFHNVEQLTDISPKQQQIISAVRKEVHKQLKNFERRFPERSGLIHADMQPNNILVHQGQHAIVDFDDCGVGLYGGDLAVALFAFEYVVESQQRRNFEALTDALLDGYSQFMPLDKNDIDMLPTFLLARKLMVLGWLEIRKTNPKLRAYFQEAVKRAIAYSKKNGFY